MRLPVRFATVRFAAFLVAVLLLVASCRQSTSIGQSHGTAPAAQGSDRTVEGEQLKQKGGLCDENRRVSNPDAESPEWVIWRLYQLALAEDNDVNFQAFVGLFPSSRNVRELKEMYWGRMRNTVHKFLTSPGKPDFVICRSIATDQGRKYYIVTSDSRQTPPPITVGESDGKNRILFLTPF